MSILEKLEHEQIFSVGLSTDKSIATFMEECDENFITKLNKEEMLQLINELTDIYHQMK